MPGFAYVTVCILAAYERKHRRLTLGGARRCTGAGPVLPASSACRAHEGRPGVAETTHAARIDPSAAAGGVRRRPALEVRRSAWWLGQRSARRGSTASWASALRATRRLPRRARRVTR